MLIINDRISICVTYQQRKNKIKLYAKNECQLIYKTNTVEYYL